MKAMILSILFLIFPIVLSQFYIIEDVHDTKNGIEGSLSLQKTDNHQKCNLPISSLSFRFFFETNERVRLKIWDKSKERWEVPGIVVSSTPEVAAVDLNYHVDLPVVGEKFSFSVTRISDQQTIIDMKDFDFKFDDQFIEFSTILPNRSHVYGLGERRGPFERSSNSQTYTLWTHSQGKKYGFHPFYIQMSSHDSSSHGVFHLNSNAMEFYLSSSEEVVRWRSIGGILDTFIFTGPRASDVVRQFWDVVGTPSMVPYWGFGAMQSRWGYYNINITRKVVSSYEKYEIPLDVVFNDIDWMYRFRDFEVNWETFPIEELQEFLNDLHESHRHYMQIFDPGIAKVDGNDAYERGIAKDVFIKNKSGKNLVQLSYAGYVVMPDWWKNDTMEWWQSLFEDHFKKVELDGIWVDENEPTASCDGECNTTTTPITTETALTFNPVTPPFVPSGIPFMNYQTVAMDAPTSIGLFYNSKNLYGYQESFITSDIYKKLKQKRGLILTRSTFSGGSRHSATKWTGDNNSNFADLANSIGGVLSLNIFGFVHSGADVCGFNGFATEELCTRWYQLSSLGYPFLRNHNTLSALPQEPYSRSQMLLEGAKKALLTRYSLLPFFYTLMYEAHVNSHLIITPLCFEFHDENDFLPSISTQFLLGTHILVSPVLKEGASQVEFYVPNAKWYNLHTGKRLPCEVKKMCEMESPLTGYVQANVRGGSIIPRKQPELTSTETRRNPFNIIVANDDDGARGKVFLDDGISLNTIEEGMYSLILFRASNDDNSMVIVNDIVQADYKETNLLLDKVTVFGVASVSQVNINEKKHSLFSFNSNLQVLDVFSMGVLVIEEFKIEIIF